MIEDRTDRKDRRIRWGRENGKKAYTPSEKSIQRAAAGRTGSREAGSQAAPEKTVIDKNRRQQAASGSERTGC